MKGKCLKCLWVKDGKCTLFSCVKLPETPTEKESRLFVEKKLIK